MTSSVSRDRVGGDRHARGQRLEQDEAKGVGEARKDEDVAAHVMPGEFLPEPGASEVDLGIPRPERGQLRAGADHELTAADDRQAEEIIKVLLDRDPADVEMDGPRQVERGRVVGAEQLGVDAARPIRDVREAARLQVLAHRPGRHHDALRRPVEPAHPGVAQSERKGQAGADVFGKAAVIGGREGQPPAQALAPRGDAERTFRRDVDALRPERGQPRGDPPARPQGEADLRIGRAGDAWELVRRDDLDAVALRLALLLDALQGAHHAVDLGRRGVGHQKDAHQAAIAALPGAVAATGRRTVSRSNWRCRAQWSSSRRPSQCSTSAEQLSTQSPAL